MGKQFLTTLMLLLLCNFSIYAYDIVNINTDEKTIEQVGINVGIQAATNAFHNEQVDTIKQRQKRLMVIVDGIMAEKELLIATYKNVAGFKQESKCYKALVAVGTDIITHSAKAVEVINKSKLSGKVRIMLNVSDLVAQAVGLGKVFADIVANSEVANPVNHPDGASGDTDKHNLLNRHERLRMANDILWRLRGIDRSIRYITYIAKTSKWKDVVAQLDRNTYITAIMTQVKVNEIISKWERVKE